MLNKCQHCHKEYKAIRTDSRFCSDKCRKALSRTNKSDIVRDKSDKIISDTTSEIKSDKVEPRVFVNHLTGEKHDITEVSKRTGLNYNLEEKSEKLGLKKYRCSGCGEPTWYGCAECGKNGGQYEMS